MTQTRARKQAYPPALIAYAKTLYEVDGLSPSQIADRLWEERGAWGKLPHPNSIGNWTKNLVRGSKPRLGEPWTLLDGTADEAALVAGVLPYLAEDDTIPGSRWPTKGEGLWIARIRRLAPTLEPFYVWRLAQRLAGAEALGDKETLRALQTVLALDPWSSDTNFTQYQQLRETGRIDNVGLVVVRPETPAVAVGRAHNATVTTKETR